MKREELSIVELKALRTKVKADRKNLAGKVVERDLTDEEQSAFDAMSAQIDALSKRIDTLEAVQDEDQAEDEDKGDDDEVAVESKERSNNPKHLDFKISTSKTRKDSGTYSIQRALQCAVNGKMQGLEGEHNQEVARSKGHAKGFWLSNNAPVSNRHRTIRRDLTTTTGAGGVGILTEPTYIDLLRSRLVLEKLGVTMKTGLKGKINIPRQNAATQFNWIGEGVNATPSNPTFDAVSFTPKTASALVNISRKEIFESSFDAQVAVENDMSQVMARGVDTAGLNGNPSVQAASPLGILQNPSVVNYTVSGDTGNGGHLSYSDALAIESIVAEANQTQDDLAWCMRPSLRGYLKGEPKTVAGTGGTAYPSFVYEADNTINGYPVEVTTEIPNGLTKGTSSACTAAIFGSWSDAYLAFWSDVDVIVNPYLYASSGAVQIVMLQECDFQLAHPAAWVIATDILTV